MYLITGRKNGKLVNIKRKTEADRDAAVQSMKSAGYQVSVAVVAESSIQNLKNMIEEMVREELAKSHPEPEKDEFDDNEDLLNDDY